MDIVFIVLICIVAAAVVVLIAKNIASHGYKCRHCSKEFYISWSKVIMTEHSGNEYRLVYPFCKTKDWCTVKPKNK